MKSNLKQHMTSVVTELIPLGVPRRHSADDRTHSVASHPPHSGKKHEHTQNPGKSLPIRVTPLKMPLQEQRTTSVKATPSSSKMSPGADQDKLPTNSVPMKKLQVNGSNHSESASKKQHITHQSSSYIRERESALTICKELNRNLKAGNAVLSTWKFPQHQKPSVPPSPTCRPVSQSPTSSAPLKEIRSPGSRDEQSSQQASAKEDKLLNGNHNSSTHRGEITPCEPATSGSKSLSVKRQRDASTDENDEGKRLCHEDVRQIPSSASLNPSQDIFMCNSPPKYVKPVYLKETGLSVLALNEQRSLVLAGEKRENTSNSFNRQLFKEPSREPRTESLKLQTEPPMTPAGDTHQPTTTYQPTSPTSDNCPSVPRKLAKKHSDEGHSSASSHSSNLLAPMHSLKITSPLCDSEPTSSSVNLKGTLKTEDQKLDPRAKPKDCTPLLPTEEEKDEKEKREPTWKDPFELSLDEDMHLGLESSILSLSSTDDSSEEQLISLKEMLDPSTHLYTTPEKDKFSELSTSTANTPEDIKNKPAYKYKNTLEQMLKEKEQNQKTKELEMQMLQNCKEDLLKLEEEDDNVHEEEMLSREHREILERFSITSCCIRDIHPGEELFTLANFGRLFDHQNLDLRKINVTPHNRAQQSLLQAQPEHVLLLLGAGLIRRAYCSSPCQLEVTHWLFKMMSVHPSPSTCAHILQALTTLALSATQHIVERNNKKFQVWAPSLQDVAQIFLNMGVSFVNLFPHEALQPTFTEGDLIENVDIQPDGLRMEDELSTFPEHNFENVIKYISLCAALCPKTYTDEDLLLLLTMVCRVSLESRLQLLPPAEITCLLENLIRNMANWETQFPQVCQALAGLSEDHHNLRRLVQLLPYSDRGKCLRRHLSLSVISKLLNGKITYIPLCAEFQLADLRRYLPRMRPSLLLKRFMHTDKAGLQEAEESVATPDQQAYYLCYSLLALMNEASTFEFPPSKQRNELQLLCSSLEKHIKCDIRENEKMLYRSKVKDLVARIYTKWQMIIQRSRPSEGKLYDYWKPPEDEIPINQESESPEHLEQEATEQPQSEDSNSNELQEEKLSNRSNYSEEEEEEEEEKEEKEEKVDKEEEHNMLVDEEEPHGGSHEEQTENGQDEEPFASELPIHDQLID